MSRQESITCEKSAYDVKEQLEQVAIALEYSKVKQTVSWLCLYDKPLSKEGLVAFTSCVINNQFYVGDIAIYTRHNGEDYRLVYPCKVLPNGKKINCFQPINREAADQLKEKITGAYMNLAEKVERMEKGSGLEIRRER